MIETLEFFGEVLLAVVGFSLVSALYGRVCQVVEGLVEVRYYLQRIMLMMGAWVREEESRRQKAEPETVVIEVPK